MGGCLNRAIFQQRKRRKTIMQKAIYIRTTEGIEVIDATPESEIRFSAMDYLESRYKKNKRKSMNRKRKLSHKLLYRFACMVGLI